MSGTSSTQPAPTDAAPLTPEQRKAYEEIGAAMYSREWFMQRAEDSAAVARELHKALPGCFTPDGVSAVHERGIRKHRGRSDRRKSNCRSATGAGRRTGGAAGAGWVGRCAARTNECNGCCGNSCASSGATADQRAELLARHDSSRTQQANRSRGTMMTVAELIAELQKIPGHKEVRMLWGHKVRPVAFGSNRNPSVIELELDLWSVVYRGPDVILEPR